MAHKRNGKIVTPKDEWETPPSLFKQLDDEFHFFMDAAATAQNRKCDTFYDKQGDALNPNADWGQRSVFLNPPYSQGNIERFMTKAHIEGCRRLEGEYVVCLIPVASDTKWWHHSVMLAKEIRFIKGRVKFIGYDDQGHAVKNSPTFSSCICIFSHISERPSQVPIIGRTIHQVNG
jgi:site-specific DNA-methyltransferase (adenine-specific)